jgi:hypothetical protein
MTTLNFPYLRTALAVVGGIGSLALAVLVIPATPSLASDVIRTAEGPVTTSAAKADAELGLDSVIGIRQPPTVQPHRAAKSNRLLRWPQAPEAEPEAGPEAEPEPEPAAADLRRNLEPLRGGVHATTDESVPAPEEPNFAPDFALGADADADAEADAEAVTATRSVPVTTDVNMRARPDNSAPVILVVPGRRHVEVIGCDFWCEVVYDGKRGWIYKGFVPGAQS